MNGDEELAYTATASNYDDSEIKKDIQNILLMLDDIVKSMEKLDERITSLEHGAVNPGIRGGRL